MRAAKRPAFHQEVCASSARSYVDRPARCPVGATESDSTFGNWWRFPPQRSQICREVGEPADRPEAGANHGRGLQTRGNTTASGAQTPLRFPCQVGGRHEPRSCRRRHCARLGAPVPTHAASCLPEFTPREAFESQVATLNDYCIRMDVMCKTEHNRKACAARDMLAYDLHHQAE